MSVSSKFVIVDPSDTLFMSSSLDTAITAWLIWMTDNMTTHISADAVEVISVEREEGLGEKEFVISYRCNSCEEECLTYSQAPHTAEFDVVVIDAQVYDGMDKSIPEIFVDMKRAIDAFPTSVRS